LTFYEPAHSSVNIFQYEVHIVCSKCRPPAKTHEFRRLRKPLIALLIVVCGKSSQICCNALFSLPESDSLRSGLKFYSWCFIYFLFFFSTREISEMRGPTGVKFCTMVSTRPYFIMPVQNFGGAPQKNFRGKNMQNLARFWTTSKFSGEYLRNGWIYSKSDFYSVYRDSSCVRRNKSGEVWSNDLGDLDVESYPPKVHFFGRPYFGP